MERFMHDILRYLDRLDPDQWILVAVGVLIVGMFCLRGFGSRKDF